MSQLGINLKFLRKQKGLSQIELGQIAGITERTIYNYEIGQKYPKARTLTSLARALEVSQDLLEHGNPETDFEVKAKHPASNIVTGEDTEFFQNTDSEFGPAGAVEASVLLDKTTSLFYSDSLSDTAKDELFESITQAYFLSKRKARMRKTAAQ